MGIPFAERIENRELRANQAASEDSESSLLGVVFGDSPCKPEGQLSTRKEAGTPGGEGGPQPAGKGQPPGSAQGEGGSRWAAPRPAEGDVAGAPTHSSQSQDLSPLWGSTRGFQKLLLVHGQGGVV